jgi:hypothetical protein
VLRATLSALPGLGGLAALSYGAWLAYPPAGFMVAGVGVLADVLWSRLQSAPVLPMVAEQ